MKSLLTALLALFVLAGCSSTDSDKSSDQGKKDGGSADGTKAEGESKDKKGEGSDCGPEG